MRKRETYFDDLNIFELLKKGAPKRIDKSNEKEVMFVIYVYKNTINEAYCTCKLKPIYEKLINFYKKSGQWQ